MKKNIPVYILCLMTFLYSGCSDLVPPGFETYQISYDRNGAGSGSIDSTSEIEGVIATTASGAALARAGYTFICWNTEADGSGDGYGAGLGMLMPSNDILLYAQWIADEYVEVDQYTGAVFNNKNVDNLNPAAYTNAITTFYLGRYEVTYQLWYTVYRYAIANGYTFANAGTEGSTGIAGAYPGTDDKVVTMINWRDTIAWCNAYSEVLGYNPVYENSSGSSVKDSRDENFEEFDSIIYIGANSGFSLPTEGEWQFAASEANDLIDAGYAPADPNAQNTVNLAGSVREWCFDRFANLPAGPRVDYYFSPIGSSNHPVVREGSQIGKREYANIGEESSDIGFRIKRR